MRESTDLKFNNYTYPLYDNCLNIANTDYNLNLPKSFAYAAFLKDSRTKNIFRFNQNLENSSSEITSDISGNIYFNVLTSSCTSGHVFHNIYAPDFTLYYNDEVYQFASDASGSMKTYKSDTSGTLMTFYIDSSGNVDGSGHFNAVFKHVDFGEIALNGDITRSTDGVTIGTVGAGISHISVPLNNDTVDYAQKLKAVSISSYVTYVDNTTDEC